MLRPNLSTDFDPAAVGKPNIEDGHMGSKRRDPSLRLSHGRCLAHDGYVVGILQQRSNPGADNLVIIKEKDTNIHRASILVPRLQRNAPRRSGQGRAWRESHSGD